MYTQFISKTGRAWIVLLLVPVFFSCASYNKMMDGYYEQLQHQQYDKALHKLEGNRFMKKQRNELLFLLEAGKLFFLKNDPVQSNMYFNRADALMEVSRRSAKDIALSNLINPMMQAYRGEDFEPFLVHFYKAINYISLNQTEEAVVEARRISLSNTRQLDKMGNKNNRYSKDAFALNLQGMLYEMNGDMNNAFIAYRNAVDVYLAAGGNYYGVDIPAQLKQDVIRTADAMGFIDERLRYEKILNTVLLPKSNASGELILFLEEGSAPSKEEKNFFLTNTGGGNRFSYYDMNGYQNTLPFDNNRYGIAETKLRQVRTFRVAMPVYRLNYQRKENIAITLNGSSYNSQLAQNINAVASSILKERFLTELANALARQVTKKLLEKGTEKAAKRMAEKKDKDDNNQSAEEKEKKKKEREEKAAAAGEVAGFIMNLANTLTEKADTRNWQSLPAYISYVRIPLQEGENDIVIQTKGGTGNLKVMGGKGMRMMLRKVE